MNCNFDSIPTLSHHLNFGSTSLVQLCGFYVWKQTAGYQHTSSQPRLVFQRTGPPWPPPSSDLPPETGPLPLLLGGFQHVWFMYNILVAKAHTGVIKHSPLLWSLRTSALDLLGHSPLGCKTFTLEVCPSPFSVCFPRTNTPWESSYTNSA